MNDVKKLLARIGAARDAISRKEEQTGLDFMIDGVLMNCAVMLKEQEAKQYNSHEVACIIADLFGDPCACNFNDIDTWLPYKCDFRETCCPNPVGVACWEQYLKHKKGR
jgi:hypothetical protein